MDEQPVNGNRNEPQPRSGQTSGSNSPGSNSPGSNSLGSNPLGAAWPDEDDSPGPARSGGSTTGAGNGQAPHGTTPDTPAGGTEADARTGENPLEATIYDRPWLNSFFRPLLTGAMGAALAMAMLAFIRRFAPDTPVAYTQSLVVLSLLASLLACYTTTWLAQPGQRNRRNIGFRAAELGLLIVLTRLATWATLDSWPTFNLLIMRPVDAILDGSFVVGLFVVAIAWLMAAALTDDQLALALQPDDLYMAQTFTDRWQDTSRPLYTDRPAIMRRFVGRWVVGGVFLVLLAAGAQFDAPEFGAFGLARQNIEAGVIVAIVVYFLCGLVLVSQGQLALLRSRWTLHKTPTADGVMRTWSVYALGLILAVGLLALLLPLGGTFWAAVIIGTALQGVYLLVLTVFQTAMGLLLFLLSLLSSDTPPEQVVEEPPAEAMMPQDLPPAVFEFPPWTGGVVFWTVIAVVLGYATYIYFSDRGIHFGWLRRFLAALRARWQELFGAYQSWQATRLRRGKETGAEKGGLLGGLPAWLRLRNLSPAQQVRYYYLSTLHRAAEAGLPRRPAETPLRYAPRLARFIEENNLEHPDEEADVSELTTAFLRVRYAEVDVTNEELPFLKRVWERLRRYLRL